MVSGFIMTIVLALALGCFTSACDSAVQVDLGPRATMNFSGAWRKIAAAGEFDPHAARIRDLDLECAPSGVPGFIHLRAGTDDGRALSFGWQPTDPGQPDARIMVVVRDDDGQQSWGSGPPVDDVLAALDEAGVRRMIAMMQTEAVTLYRMQLLNAPGGGVADGTVLMQDPVFLWENGAFRSLFKEDDWRVVNGAAAYFFVTGAVPVSSPDTSMAGDDLTTVTSQYQGSTYAFFVIPLVPR